MDIIATNITSPLGITTDENLNAVVNGHTALRRHEAGERGVPFVYCASLFEETPDFEVLAYDSASRAIAEVKDIDRRRTVFILSSTKGDITTPLAETARHIARKLGIDNEPIVVCNACISGVAAMVLAMRMLRSGAYDYAVVTGADAMSDFIVSGFQALKALSPEPCRPFDIERLGLNLGEAAATIVAKAHATEEGQWRMTAGATANDAYHLTNPHPQGEGAYRALAEVMRQTEATGTHEEWLGEISAHGTATMYNDQMESKAIQAAELSDIPANTVKGYFGHTLGAAGILETVITMRSVAEGELLGTRGFSEIGVSGRMSISAETVPVGRQSFLKIISGFGGCNAAIYCRQTEVAGAASSAPSHDYTASHRIQVTPRGITVDGQPLAVTQTGAKMLTEVYKRYIGDYPKYYKMDALAQLGFVATELLLRQEGEHPERRTDRAIVLFNHSSSLCADRDYERSIADKANYFPSPSVFVYTLPNIVCGEMAIRHGYHAETSFYILNGKDEAMMHDILRSTFQDSSLRSILAGWIDRRSADDFEADLKIIQKTN